MKAVGCIAGSLLDDTHELTLGIPDGMIMFSFVVAVIVATDRINNLLAHCKQKDGTQRRHPNDLNKNNLNCKKETKHTNKKHMFYTCQPICHNFWHTSLRTNMKHTVTWQSIRHPKHCLTYLLTFSLTPTLTCSAAFVLTCYLTYVPLLLLQHWPCNTFWYGLFLYDIHCVFLYICNNMDMHYIYI